MRPLLLALVLTLAAPLLKAQPLDAGLVGRWVQSGQDLPPDADLRVGYAELTIAPDGACTLLAFVEERGDVEVNYGKGSCAAADGTLQGPGAERAAYALVDGRLVLRVPAPEGDLVLRLQPAAGPAEPPFLGRWLLTDVFYPGDPPGPATLSLADESLRFETSGTGTWIDGDRVARFTFVTGGPYLGARFAGEGYHALRARFRLEGDRLTLEGTWRGRAARLTYRRLDD